MSDDGVTAPSASYGQALFPSINQRQHHYADYRTQVEWFPIPLKTENLPIFIHLYQAPVTEPRESITFLHNNPDMQFAELTRVLGNMDLPLKVQQIIVENIHELVLGLGNMVEGSSTTDRSGYFSVTIHDAPSIDLNIVPDDEEDDHTDNITSSSRVVDLYMEPDNDDWLMKLEDRTDALLAELHDLLDENRYVNALAQELIALTEIDTDNDDPTVDDQLMNYRDFQEADDDPFGINEILLMMDMETDTPGNEEIDRITLESMETFTGMTIPDQPPQNLYSSSADDIEYDDPIINEILQMIDFDNLMDRETDMNGTEEVERILLESTETYTGMTIPASKAAIEELEKVRLESVEAASDAGSCTICMEDFEAGVEATRLPCQHLYHGDCVVRWLEIDHRCPLCRFSMPDD